MEATATSGLETASTVEGWVEVAVYPHDEAFGARGLVVLAMGLPYWAVPGEGGLRLLVPEASAAAVREQLGLFERESRNWPPRPAKVTRHREERARPGPPLVWAALLVATFWMQLTRPAVLEARLAMDGASVLRDGEWWRPLTALFLHADLGHLLSNLVAGVFVIALIAPVLGLVRGWILLGLASVAGNITAAMLHGIDHYRSLGASTAIFAGIGLLTGREVGRLLFLEVGMRLRNVLGPAFAGCCLLALLGGGGPATDVVAHATGFGCGLVVALGATLGDAFRDRTRRSRNPFEAPS